MIWIILIIGTILRAVSLNQSLWLDEAINVLAAKNVSFLGIVTQYAVADFHPPGWFVILWIWTKLFGYSEIAVRIPSFIFGVLTIYITYLLGQKLVSKNLGLLAALLLTINPLHIYYSQEARMYALATLAVTVNIFLLTKMVKEEKLNLIFLSFSNFAVLMSDYLAYFIFPAQFIFLLLSRREVFKRWTTALIGSMIMGIWWLPIFLSQLNIGTTISSQLPTWKFVVGGFDLKALPLTFVKFIIGRISLANKQLYVAALIPVSSLFIFLLWKGLKSVNGFSQKLLLAWVMVPLIIAVIVSLFVPVYSYFRVLFIMPAFVILMAGGILFFKGKLRYTLLGVVLLIEIFSSLVYLVNSAYQREDWKGLVNFFQNQKPQIILFESSGTLSPFDYYAKGGLNAVGALTDIPAKDESSVSKLENSLTGYKEVYLVDYLVQVTDPQRLASKKLNQLGYKERNIVNFTGVGFVYHYVKE